MRRAEDIKRVFKKAGLRIGCDADERVFADVLQARHNVTENRPALPESRWRAIMKSPVTRFAVAAAVLIACGIGLSVWRTTGSGVALADVLARVEKVKAVRYQWTYTLSGYIGPNKPYHQEIRATSLNSAEYGWKDNSEWIDPNGGESWFSEGYVLPQKKLGIHIGHRERTYIRKVLKDAKIEEDPHIGHPNMKDPGGFVRRILKTKYETLGRSTMDGIEVAGFRSTDPNLWEGKNPQVDFKLWVDVKTLLPVRSDILASVEVDERGDRLSNHFVIHDFQWDVPVDAGEFEPPPVPEGYLVLDNPPAQVNEEAAIEGLKRCVELFGCYLESITWAGIQDGPSLFEKSETPAALRLKEEMKGLSKQEKNNRLIRPGIPILSLYSFYHELVQNKKDPAYYGKTVTPKDADKVLMRWKLSDTEYRVIFGDLHAETVSPERLTELERSLPK
jgi:hypothetical protein